MNTVQTIEQMRQSPYVKEKKLLNGISSFNFTRKAFWDKHWTATTVKARGLFIDTINGRIKARSFDKFFTIGERRETELDILAENFEYPVKAYVKYNGYLGICTGEPDEKGGYRLWCASKSTDQGWYAARFEDLLRKTLGNDHRMDHFCRTLYENNYTAIFEVIDPVQDPHIIEYNEPQVILLALVMNDDEDMDFYCKTDEVIEFYNATWRLPYKELAYTINNAEELYQWYNIVRDPLYTYNGRDIEGFVLQDLDDHMVKVKTVYYDLWKSFRPLTHTIYKGDKIDSWKHTEKLLQKIPDLSSEDLIRIWRFIHWLEKTVPILSYEPSIIEIRKMWIDQHSGEL
jgi:tRNA splicing ligase